MKFFVTGRSSNYEGVKAAFDEIEKRGHEITFRWTDLPMVKPYAENEEKAGEFAVGAISGVCAADIYIILAHEDGNGVFTELGAALASKHLTNKPAIYAIGDCRDSAMFYYHRAIQWRPSLYEVFAEVI